MRSKVASLLAAVISLGAMQAALAADMPIKAPPAIVSNWNGAYLGVSLGARWTDPDWNTTCLQPGLAGVTCPGVFPARFVANNPTDFNSTGFKGGLYLGYNWQVAPTWVVGVEGDFAWGDNKKTKAGIPGAEDPAVAGSPGLDSSSVKQTWDASLRLRGGYLITPTTMVYATGGAAFTHLEASVFCGTAFAVGWCAAANVGRTDSQSTNRVGWTVGGGVEAMVWGNWLARAEYRYADYGTWSATYMQGPATNIDALSADIKVRTHTAQVGLAYRFMPR